MDGEPLREEFPDNVKFYYSLDENLAVRKSQLEISGHTWDDPERLVGTNVTLHF